MKCRECRILRAKKKISSQLLLLPLRQSITLTRMYFALILNPKKRRKKERVRWRSEKRKLLNKQTVTNAIKINYISRAAAVSPVQCTLLRHPLRSDVFAPLLLPLLPVESKLSHRRRCLSFKAKIVHQIECACCTHRTSVRTILTSVRMNVRIFLSTRVMRFFSHPIVFYCGRRCEEDALCAHRICVPCALTDKTSRSGKSTRRRTKN